MNHMSHFVIAGYVVASLSGGTVGTRDALVGTEKSDTVIRVDHEYRAEM